MAETDLRGGLKLREILAEVEKALAGRSQVAFDSPTHIVTRLARRSPPSA